MSKRIEDMTSDEVVEHNVMLIEKAFAEEGNPVEAGETVTSAMCEVMQNTTRWKRAHNV